MPTRTGFDLQPDQCRIVDVHVRSLRPSTSSDVAVRSFAQLPVGGESPSLSADLGRIRQDQRLARQAWATVWGLRSVHQFLRLPPARDSDLEALAIRESRRDLAPLESDGAQPVVALMVGADVQVGTHRRREVSLVAVSEAEVRRAIQPLSDAGFDVVGVSTPAMALASVARQHGGIAAGATVALVALEAHATCVAIVRDGVLLFAREIQWGFGEAQEPVDVRLAAELRRSMLFFRQTFRTAVAGVVLCGGMANMRSLTAPVGSALGVPVQTLDSLSGIDAEAIPQPADAFRASVASLRLAIATAAESAPCANLLPLAIRSTRERRAELIRVAGAVAAGLLVVAAWYGLTRGTGPTRVSEVAAVEPRIALLEPEAERISALRRTWAMGASRQAALSAFESQGPRLARLLEVLSRATPREVVLNEIDAQAEGAHWRTVLSGMAITADPAAGQGAVTGLFQRLSQSPFVGPTAQPPSFRVVSGRGGAGVEEAPARSIPEGMSGVEFSALFRVPK